MSNFLFFTSYSIQNIRYLPNIWPNNRLKTIIPFKTAYYIVMLLAGPADRPADVKFENLKKKSIADTVNVPSRNI
jgi:hypothetical protein